MNFLASRKAINLGVIAPCMFDETVVAAFEHLNHGIVTLTMKESNGFLRHALRHVAEKHGATLVEGDPSYTSQMCPHSGHTSKANWRGCSYFGCKACGYEANRDRAASLNIALRAAQTHGTSTAFKVGQLPEGNASVSRRVSWQGEGFERPRQIAPSCRLTSLSGGCLTTLRLHLDQNTSLALLLPFAFEVPL